MSLQRIVLFRCHPDGKQHELQSWKVNEDSLFDFFGEQVMPKADAHGFSIPLAKDRDRAWLEIMVGNETVATSQDVWWVDSIDWHLERFSWFFSFIASRDDVFNQVMETLFNEGHGLDTNPKLASQCLMNLYFPLVGE